MTHPQQPEVGVVSAAALAREAAERVGAYRDFLAKNGLNPDKLDEKAFRRLPPVTKDNYLRFYKPAELVWDDDLGDVINWAASSGSSGKPFYWPRSRKSLYDSIRFHEQILRGFGADQRTTLTINTFAMSTWIAGAYTLIAVNGINDLDMPVSVISPGIEMPDVVRALIELAPNYEQVVIAGYPPFVKDILDEVAKQDPKALDHDIKLLFAGELITERWRDHVLEKIGKPGDLTGTVLIYGTADAGMMGFETPLSIAIRRAAHADVALREGLFGKELTHLPTFVEYDPVARYIETDDEGYLLFTIDTTLPLIRYRINDEGEVYDAARMRAILEAYGHADLASKVTDQNFLCMAGRSDVATTIYAANIFNHHVLPVFDDLEVTDKLTGYFHMPHPENEDLSQTLRIMFELSEGVEPSEELRDRLTELTIRTLQEKSGEYRKLCAEKGDTVRPVVSLHLKGSQQEFARGAKQKFIGKKP